MKTQFNLLFIPAMFFITAAVAQTSKSQLLAGSWKLQSLKAGFPAKITAKEKAKDQKIIADDEKDFKKSGFNFTKTGGLVLGEKKFTWTMSSDGNMVKVMKGNKVVTLAKIVELNPRHLVFIRPDEGMQVTYTLTR